MHRFADCIPDRQARIHGAILANERAHPEQGPAESESAAAGAAG